jgi:hypothetical protein
MSEPTTPDTTGQTAELRAAATTLRGVAVYAPAGPWKYVENACDDDGAIMAPESLGWDALVMDVKSEYEKAPARWAAPVHPGMAVHFADLFDLLAEFTVTVPDLVREHVDGEPCGDYACGIVTRARLLARVLNGGG